MKTWTTCPYCLAETPTFPVEPILTIREWVCEDCEKSFRFIIRVDDINGPYDTALAEDVYQAIRAN